MTQKIILTAFTLTLLSTLLYAQPQQEKIDQITVVDVNDDGKDDLAAIINTPRPKIVYFLNQGNGFSEAKLWKEQMASPYSVLSGDMVGDSKKDLGVIIQEETAVDFQLYVAENLGNDNFGPFRKIRTGVPAIDGAVADVTKDGKNDIILLANEDPGSSGSIIYVLPGLGNGNYGQAIDFAAQDTWATAITAGDVTKDGKPEVIILSEKDLETIMSYSTDEGTGYQRFQGVIKLPHYDTENNQQLLKDVVYAPEVVGEEPGLMFLLQINPRAAAGKYVVGRLIDEISKNTNIVILKNDTKMEDEIWSYEKYKEFLPGTLETEHFERIK